MSIDFRCSRPGCFARRTAARLWRGRVLAAAIVVASAVVVACGGAAAFPVIPSAVPDTSTLAGTWKGSVEGSYGYTATTMILKADSTYTQESENPLYCKVSGKWAVSGTRFSASGRDCDGVTVTPVAPVDKLRLTGTWTASSGRSGTFTVAKQ